MTDFSGFLNAEDGAVTVDWVVLTAAIVGLGIAAIGSVRTGSGSLALAVENSLSTAQVTDLGCLGANATGPCGANGPASMPVDDEEISLPPDGL